MSTVQPGVAEAATAPMSARDARPRGVLLVLESVFPARGGGGAESQVLTLGKRLRAEGYDARVVVPRLAHGPQAVDDAVDGLPVTRIAYPHVKLLGGVLMLARLAMLLIRRRHEYDVIHVHIAHNMAVVAALLGPLLGKRVVVKITGMRELSGGILDPHAGLAARLRRAAIRRVDLVQSTSTRIASAVVASGFRPAQSTLLPNAVDCERFARATIDPGRKALLRGAATRVGIYVGRLQPEKGQEPLLRAWAQAVRGREDMRLVLVGDGRMREPLEALCRELGIAPQVFFAGHRDDIPSELRAADFALLTSLAEGLSNSMLEYMASGLPVLGSRVSGTEDFVATGETGWLVEPGDTAELAAALARVAATDPADLRLMGERARERVAAAASIDAVTAKLLRSYGFPPRERASA